MSLHPLQVGRESSAQLAWERLLGNIWGLSQPALPRSFCSRGHLRREERKDSFVGGRRRSLLPFPRADLLHTHGTDFAFYLYK